MRSARKTIHGVRRRRVARVRAKLAGTAERPRLAVFRSLKHISAQVIDDTTGRTIAAVHDQEVAAAADGRISRATAVGTLIAQRAAAAGVTAVVLDRRYYRYHGQVKAVAEAARAAGLTF